MTSQLIKYETRDEWLRSRSKGIGGSDIAAILGANTHRTPYQVWEDKTERGEKFEGNKFTRRGQYMEDAVSNYFEDVTGHRLIKASDTDEILIHKQHPFILGSPDRRYFDSEGGKGVLECKTTMMSIDQDVDSLPKTWFIQLQWYLGLTGYKRGTIAWAELGYTSDFKHLEIDFNPMFFAYMVDEACKFWNDYVLTDTPPPATTSEDVERIYATHTESKYINASTEFLEMYNELKELTAQIKELTERSDNLKEGIKLALMDAEGATYQDQVLVTWKSSKPGMKFDASKLKAEKPDVWMQYANETPGSRRFLVK